MPDAAPASPPVAVQERPKEAVEAAASEGFVVEDRRHAVLFDADLRAYQAWLDRMRASGFRPHFVGAHDAAGGPRFAGIAVKNEDGRPWEAYVEPVPQADQLRSLNELSMAKRRGRPIGKGSFTLDGSPAQATLWDTSARGEILHVSLPGSPGIREETGRNEGREYEARLPVPPPHASRWGLGVIFRPDDGNPWMAWPDLTAPQFRAALDEWRSKGYHPDQRRRLPRR